MVLPDSKSFGKWLNHRRMDDINWYLFTWYVVQCQHIITQEIRRYNPILNKQFAIENGPVEIVDLPIENGGSFHCIISISDPTELHVPNVAVIPSLWAAWRPRGEVCQQHSEHCGAWGKLTVVTFDNGGVGAQMDPCFGLILFYLDLVMYCRDYSRAPDRKPI